MTTMGLKEVIGGLRATNEKQREALRMRRHDILILRAALAEIRRHECACSPCLQRAREAMGGTVTQ